MITNILLIIAWIYIVIGMIGVFKFKKLYSRLLAGTTIDTVATLTILIALIIFAKDLSFTIRLILIIIFILITNPISNHVIIRSAFISGVSTEEEVD